MPRPGRFLPALTTVFLLYAPLLAALGSIRNRYFLFWRPADTVAVCACIVLLALLGTGVGILLDRTGSRALGQARDYVFLLLLGLGLLVNGLPLLHFRHLLDALRRNRGMALEVLDFAFGFSVAFWLVALVVWRRALLRAARAACLILSPLVILVIGPALFWEPWEVRPDPIPAAAADRKPGTPIYFMVFDEWSYARSTEGADFLDDLPHLRELRGHSMFFREARSADSTTYRSLPEIIFQSHDLESLPGVFVKQDADPASDAGNAREFVTRRATPENATESLFTLARRAGYATTMLGFYLPYRLILGDGADKVRAYCNYPKGKTFLGRMVLLTLESPQYWRLPYFSSLWKRMYAPIFSRHWVELDARMHKDVSETIVSAPERSFVFVHYPIPHAPFVFDADGTYRGPFPIQSGPVDDIDQDIMAGSPADYHRSLRNLDRIVGEFVADLKRAGHYDRALLILTSDHSWRNDPAFESGAAPGAVHHVPLLIKLPGQQTPRTVGDMVNVRDLKALIDHALHGPLSEEDFDALVAKSANGGHGDGRASRP